MVPEALFDHVRLASTPREAARLAVATPVGGGAR
jgi:hypothetical protein